MVMGSQNWLNQRDIKTKGMIKSVDWTKVKKEKKSKKKTTNNKVQRASFILSLTPHSLSIPRHAPGLPSQPPSGCRLLVVLVAREWVGRKWIRRHRAGKPVHRLADLSSLSFSSTVSFNFTFCSFNFCLTFSFNLLFFLYLSLFSQRTNCTPSAPLPRQPFRRQSRREETVSTWVLWVSPSLSYFSWETIAVLEPSPSLSRPKV